MTAAHDTSADRGLGPRFLAPRTVIAIIVVVVVAAVAVAVTRSDGDSASDTASSRSDAGRHEPVSGAAQPQRRFINIGTNTGQQFSDAEFQELALDYGYVIFTKFHAGWDITRHHEATHRLKALNPSIKVLPYFSTKYWFDKSRWGVSLDPAWLLRDKNGQLVQKTHAGETQDDAAYIDVANPDYRAWALSLLTSWLQAAPYDGVFFDAADPIGDYDPDEIEKWDALLGPERVAAYNAGIRDLLARAKALAGPGRHVVYNGISPSPIRGAGRDLDLLTVSDGALNERFCLNTKGGAADIRPDLSLLESTDKTLFMRATFGNRVAEEDRDQLVSFCLGSFLLGWRPGLSYFQVAIDYTAKQLGDQQVGLDLDLGQPLGPATVDGDLATRAFERGTVVVNLGNRNLQYTAVASAEEVRRGRVEGRVAAGDSITVAAHDAVFLTS